MNDFIGLALRPMVSCSAPASRPLASLANGTIQKSATGRIQQPIVIDFHSDNGKEEIRKWYNEQPVTRFHTLELRKDIDGPFRHEFIVVHLGLPGPNRAVCRFDRRAREDMRGNALKVEGTASEDTAHVFTPADIESKAKLDKSIIMLIVQFNEAQDLKLMLAICCGIQSHPNAKSYSLLRYNCYFFCWTLVTATTRQASKWEISAGADHRWEGVVDQLLWNYKNGYLLLSRDKKRIYQSMMTKLRDYSLDISPAAQEKILLQTQLYPVLWNAISLALKEGGRIGVEQLTNDVARGSWLPSIARKRTLQRAQKISTEWYDKLIALSDTAIRQALKKWYCPGYYSDIFNEGYPSQIILKYDPPIEGYIRDRMKNHFEQVEKYGFGNAKELKYQATKTMCEIWVSVVNMMKDDSQFSFH